MEHNSIEELAENLKGFFGLFDIYFLHNPEGEDLLKQAKASLEEKVSRNESLMAVLTAIGENYDSAIDQAKIKELDALLQLLAARREIMRATMAAKDRDKNRIYLRQVFGIDE